ncbi:hypothetical protein ebA4243 [Aromatoleum aromaticum EbN1]|uniref:Uncharacterized protein n=1 Tax=Aromatoleum aromaticum (strain DSM 19018 / LMG 30748 / EbN1) TaxID=76114 RepID=Q5P2E0_AROAE|nr:hypothetical protein ebA4243 [Aromatoleum aromaticum EbN1]
MKLRPGNPPRPDLPLKREVEAIVQNGSMQAQVKQGRNAPCRQKMLHRRNMDTRCGTPGHGGPFPRARQTYTFSIDALHMPLHMHAREAWRNRPAAKAFGAAGGAGGVVYIARRDARSWNPDTRLALQRHEC